MALRYLKVQCTSEGPLQTQDLGQSPLVGSTAAADNNNNNRSQLRWPHVLIVHADGAPAARARGMTFGFGSEALMKPTWEETRSISAL